jgi:predicted nucleotidyltransferase
MALKDSKHDSEIDLFRLELVNIIDNRHALVQLAKRIDWQACEGKSA